MASPDLTARLRYLSDSAHLLAATAPATSKYLMSKCNSLMFDNDIELSESHRRKVCGACGTIMILGWDGKLEAGSQRRGARGKSISGKALTDRARAMVYKCESCGRKTRINISTSPSSVPKYKSAISHTNHTLSITEASNTSQSGGKKRTKSRKQGGLEAILARRKATDSRSSGFDLLDFMKKA